MNLLRMPFRKFFGPFSKGEFSKSTTVQTDLLEDADKNDVLDKLERMGR